MSTFTDLTDRISVRSEKIIDLLKREGLLKEAVVAAVVFTFLLIVLL